MAMTRDAETTFPKPMLMIINPFDDFFICITPTAVLLLQVLHLLFDLFKVMLHFNNSCSDIDVLCLGTDRVYFPAQFLYKEIDLLADRETRRQQVLSEPDPRG